MLFYNIGLHILHFSIGFFRFFNAKAKLFVDGRKQTFPKLEAFNNALKEEDIVFWFHCASLGEFEQARPLIEQIKTNQPQIKIAVSFFSPSGYEIQKNYTGADLVFYLPKATKSNAAKVLSLLRPQNIFFIKYEFWLNYINETKRAGIPIYLVSALFNTKQIFFKWHGKLFLNVLYKYTMIFVQDESSFLLLEKYNIKSKVSGDTRFDRVLANKKNAKKNDLIVSFAGDKKIIVVGSSWEKEEEMILNTYDPSLNYKIIIAPHDIQRTMAIPSDLRSIEYSKASSENIQGATVLIIDNIGMLSSLYSYANLALVGGGYRGALHNILEAAVFGIPVLYGYQTQKHPEAEALQEAGGGIIINNEQKLSEVLDELFTNEPKMKKMGEDASNFIAKNAGATQKILSEI